jgi:hypothetical protein
MSDELSKVDEHIALAERRLSRLRLNIARSEARERPTVAARDLLAASEMGLRAMYQYRKILVRGR